MSMPDHQLMTFQAPRVEQGDDDAADLVCAPHPTDTRVRVEAEGPLYHRTWAYLSAALYHDVFMTLARAADRTTSIGFGAGGMIPDRVRFSAADRRALDHRPFVSEVAFQPGGPDTARELESSSRVVEGV